jgi:hypothetical protein
MQNFLHNKKSTAQFCLYEMHESLATVSSVLECDVVSLDEWFQMLRHVMSCHVIFTFSGQQSKNLKATYSIETPRTTHSAQQCHLPKSLNPQQHLCENLKYHKIMFFNFQANF